MTLRVSFLYGIKIFAHRKLFKDSSLKKVMLNLPNKITLLRILLIPVFVSFLLSGMPYNNWISAIIFLLLSFTDYLDGYYARKKKLVTNVGKILDPIADKLLTSVALILLIGEWVPLWAAIVIIFREVLLTGLRLFFVKRRIVIPASFWGKSKTVMQIMAITAAILKLPGTFILTQIMVGMAVFLTVVSGILYLKGMWQQVRS